MVGIQEVPMVSALRCPNAKCRKYMLVELEQQGKTIPCLICKQPIAIPVAPVTVPVVPKKPDRIEPVIVVPVIYEAEAIALVAADDEPMQPIFDDGPQFTVE